MYLDGRTRQRLGAASNRLSRWLAVLFPFSIAGSLWGQSYLVPPQGFQGAPGVPAMGTVVPPTSQSGSQVGNQTIERINDAANGEPNNQQGNQNANAKENPNAAANGEANATAEGSADTTATPLTPPVDAIMRWGAVHTHLRAGYQFLYASGLHVAPGVTEDTFTHTITPGLSLELGPHVTLDYSPSFRFYSEKGFHDTIDQAVSLNAGIHVDNWTFGASQSLATIDDPSAETSAQTEQTLYSGGLVAVYSFNEKVSLATTAGVSFVYAGNSSVLRTNSGGIPIPTHGAVLSDSQSYSGGERLNLGINDRLSLGAGISIGYINQSGGFTSVSLTYDGNITWRLGTRISANLTAGIQEQRFLHSNASELWNPVYSGSLSYQAFDQTSFSIYANRGVSASLFANQITETTAVGVGVQQRLVGKLHASLGAGYTLSDYKVAEGNLSTARSDSGYSVSAGIYFPFLKRCTFSAFYAYSQNISTFDDFGYSSSQVGLNLSWAY